MARNVFNPMGDAAAAMPFTFAGVEYKKGDPFPHAKLGLHETELRGMWLADRIDFVAREPVKQKQQQHAAR